MSENFSINPNFKTGQFENSISEYNKVFSNSINQTEESLSGKASFDEVFNSLGAQKEVKPLQASAQYNIGVDSITAQKIENLSPSAKMASDLGRGLMKGLSEVSDLNKEAENAFETFASGGDMSIADVMIASQKSSLAMQMAIQLRNQMVNAYNEFKNMSI